VLGEEGDRTFKSDLLGEIPKLRAFAMSLIGKADRADDLVQETLMKAWAHRDSFQPGTKFRAWLYAILRNEFYTYHRKRRREVEDADGKIAANMAVLPEQHIRLDLEDMNAALLQLPANQREVLLLVTASDMSYEEAAAICGVAVGTIKSRVNRARAKISEILQTKDVSELGPESAMQAALISKSV
jgi:RNA polymerase sigma-70 factor, ECF subfamily